MQTKLKKLLALLLAVVMIASAMPMSVLAADETATYTKVTSAPEDWSGEYLLVYEADTTAYVFDGSLASPDVVKNYKEAAIADGKIEADRAISVTIEAVNGGYVLKSASGLYLYHSSDANKLSSTANQSTAAKYPLTLSVTADGVDMALSNGPHMRFNASADQMRFRYYKSGSYTGQKAVTLYKLEEPAAEAEYGYVQVTELADITAGGQFLIAAETDGSYKALGTTIDKKIVPVGITVADGIATTTAEMLPVWTLAAEGSGVSLSNGTSYLAYDSSTNFKSSDAAYEWTVVEDGSGTFKIKIGPNDSRAIGYGISQECFGAYASTTSTYIYDLAIFKYMELPEGTTPEPDPDPEPEQPTISTIAEAVAGANGNSFTVKGVVTLLDGQNIYLQDATGGICLRVSGDVTGVSLGDTLIGTGNRATYNGLPQLGSGTYEKSEGLTLSAKETTIGELTTADLCTYIKLSGVEVTEVYDNNGAYSTPNITVTDGTNSIQIYKAVVSKDEAGAWSVKVGDKLDVLAAVGCYNTTLQLRNTNASEISLVSGGTTPEPEEPTGPIKDGDKVVIYNPANMMALSSTYSGYYNNGVAVTVEAGKLSGYTDAEVWTVGVNEDGSYTFSTADGKKLSLGASFTSMPLDDVNTAWTISDAETADCYYIKNAARGNYVEYQPSYGTWSAYTSINDEALFAQKFYVVGDTIPDPGPDPEPEVTYIEKMTALPEDGDTIVIYNSGNAMGSAASGKKLAGVAATVTDNKLPLSEDMAQLLVTIDEDGNYIFTCDGKYLTSAETGNGLSFAEELTDCGKWTMEQVEGADAWYIKNVGANYNGNYNQAMEYYSGFTTYGIKETEIYQMQLFMVKEAAGETGKITSADQFVTGTYVMVVDGGYAPGVLDGTWVSVVQPVISGDVVTDAKGGIWTLTVNGSSVKITDSNGVSIKPKGGNNNGIASGDYDWAWTFDANTQTFTFAGTGSDTVKLASNASEDATYGGFHKFRGYKNTTISGNPAQYPCNFTLYKVEAGADVPESGLPEAGEQVVIYNLSAEGVLAEQNDTQSINNALAEIVDGKAIPENGGVVFTVEVNGGYYRFYNETYGYLCSNGTGNNAFYSQTASEDADWKLLEGKSGGYNLESRTAKFNGSYSQYLEYYADSYKTYSMYNVTDYDIYEFFFYPVAESVSLTGGIVNMPSIDFGTMPDAYVGVDYSFSFTVNSVFGVDTLTVMVNGSILAPNNDGSYTVPAELVTGSELTITVSGTDTKGTAISGTAKVAVKDEPVIGEVTPAAGTETLDDKRPVISAELLNIGENAEYTMTVNDEEVAAVLENGVLSYTPEEDMADGRTTVKVTVVRADGKEATKTWSFTVGEAQYQLYFGQLHAHTTYSDGSGSLESALDYIENLPENANVDFVAFTDHSNYFDASGAANPEGALYDPSLMTANSKSLWSAYTGAMFDFNASQNKVVAVPGFEMTWSGGPGHINTFNTPGIVSRNNTTLNSKTADAGMKAYYALISQPEGAGIINQFNHPGSTFGTFTDFAYWDALVDTRIQLVEVGNGEGQVGAGGYYPSYEYYTMALDKGWHVAPTNNQDNHKGKWGNANDARDVIITDDFSLEGIYEAIRSYRVYATEDKNLEIGYTVNDLMMGSIISEVPESLTLDVTVYDPDSSDSISKVEVIVNSGKVAYTWSDPSDLADGALSVTLDPTYSYYYLRVTEGDGDIAVTAPVWVGEALKLGISSVECGTSTPVTDEELTITTTLFNSETTAATVKSLTYTVGSEVIGTDTTGYTIPASGTLPVEFKWTPTTAKITKVTVTAVVDLKGEEYVFTMDIELDIQDASKLVYIGIDASHFNEYVAGNYSDSMGNFSALAAQYGVRTVELKTSAELIAACSNDKYVGIILTAPSRRNGSALRDPYATYSDAEIAALKAFNADGGALILTGWGDYYESYTSFPAEDHMAAQQNKILAAIGSSLRISDDETKDDSHNGGQSQRLYLSVYDFESFLLDGVEYDADHPHDNMYTELYSQYGGASIYVVDSTGEPTANVPETVNPAVYGFETTYSADDDKDSYGGLGSTQKYTVGDTQHLMVLASEQLPGQGLIVVAGAAFLSNFEVQATIEDSGAEKNYSNYKICENLLAYLNPVEVTPIAEVQAQTEVGVKYTIEGVVTSNASGYDKDTAFFDCIYVQDATGGICCFPVAGNYKIGDLVRITGTTEFYQGEPELQVSSIEVIGEGSVEPTEVSAAQINDRSVEGMLITLSGTVESFEYANELVQTIMVKDANGDVARVFIDGYITIDKDVENLAVGAKITVTGLASYDDTFNAPEGPFPRIRVRDRADVVCEIVEYTVTFDVNGGNALEEDSMTVTLGTAYGTLPVPTRTGYTFVGWYLGETEITAETIVETAEDHTLVAKWEINVYTVSFDSNGGSEVDEQQVEYGSTAEEPTEPSREGYKFVGWYLNGEEYDFTTPVTEDITLVAEWDQVIDVTPVDPEQPDDPEDPVDPEDPDEPELPEWPFTDVTEDDWFYQGVYDVYYGGIMNGISDTLFAPNLELSRAMLATMLYRLSGEEYTGEMASFEDVAEGQWYSEAIAWAAANGIVNGFSATEFRPNADVTREQAAAMLYRYAQYKGYDVSVGETTDLKAFTDAESVSDYAVAAMQWAVGAGIINGVAEDTLAPTANSTRAQAATMFSRFMSWCEAE